MAENTKIEWTDHTFNPWEGCQKVGPGCDNCYAETRNARFAGGQAVNWGPGAPRRMTGASNWNKPLKWNKQAELQNSAWEGFKKTNPDLTDDELIAEGFFKPRRGAGAGASAVRLPGQNGGAHGRGRRRR